MKVKEAFDQFNQLKIAVLGDVMIDSYIRGKVTRISPEAPVPIISLSKKEDRLGGAANVAVNLVALGIQTEILSVVGTDDEAVNLQKLLDENGIHHRHMVQSPNRKTTIKTRVIGNNQHLLRVDNEQTNDITTDEETALINATKKAVDSGVHALILEDYNKGILTKRVIEEVVQYANKKGVITTVDPKKNNFLSYKNVTLFKPNLKELKEGLLVDFEFEQFDQFEQAVLTLENHLGNAISFVTLSENGVYVKKGEKSDHIPAHLRKISDVSGAGDTVIGVATACLSIGMEPYDMAQIANLAGGLVCERSGVVAIDKNLLMKEVERVYNGH